jgi:hypothetical protein
MPPRPDILGGYIVAIMKLCISNIIFRGLRKQRNARRESQVILAFTGHTEIAKLLVHQIGRLREGLAADSRRGNVYAFGTRY